MLTLINIRSTSRISANRSPLRTNSPTFTKRVLTVPFRGDLIKDLFRLIFASSLLSKALSAKVLV